MLFRSWNLQKSIDKHGIITNDIGNPTSWDTEVTFGMDLIEAGMFPYMLGRDRNFRLLSDKWHSHCRSYTTGKVYEKKYAGLLKNTYGLSLEILLKEFEQEIKRLKEMLEVSWKVDINKYNPI